MADPHTSHTSQVGQKSKRSSITSQSTDHGATVSKQRSETIHERTIHSEMVLNTDILEEVESKIGGLADETEDVEEEKEPEHPYEPPPFNFIKIEFGGRFTSDAHEPQVYKENICGLHQQEDGETYQYAAIRHV
ncbi:hypothetical protein ElyMa_006695100 [Elysia marginata]|uniref:Uncharacterized protein n=1 Tax=Elysia marginata TaxID=1093978 RepID=A0AAV4IUZ4_9GAST|nr:hypothetical protein ElyMa_006695100 [Elysia marginata]